jgi:hypothetical protein
MVVVPAGTELDVYPASNDALDIPLSKLVANPDVFEDKLKESVSAPAVVNVINAVAIFYYIKLYSAQIKMFLNRSV